MKVQPSTEKLIESVGVIAERIGADPRVRDAVTLVLGWQSDLSRVESESDFEQRLRAGAPPATLCAQHAHALGMVAGMDRAYEILVDPDRIREIREQLKAQIEGAKQA